MSKILNHTELLGTLKKWQSSKLKIVFTNGCFDIIHRGHVEYLNKAKSFGDKLIIGLNSDTSVKKLKGKNRPFTNENDRAYIIANLKAVDAVAIFEEDTPFLIINKIKPDILVKGGDYKIDEIVGKDIVEKNGGKVITVPYISGKSTTNLLNKIKKSV